MNDVVIRLEDLGKQYHIGGKLDTHRTLRDNISRILVSPFRRVGKLLRGQSIDTELDETIWALKDVSFEINRGEVIGVIGRNGAGKSTLLKILARITEPTEGYADIHGRVGSLLEVGTGFHPELTGRENIYLNGAILGMRRAEIEQKFEEIVDFAEIQRFIDTPVKRYSSGMYLRLAFAVAAHLEPEILLVDEVLAVGDIAFQRKCLGKMGDVAREGRTVLLVSHNIAAVQSLCTRCLLVDGGRQQFYGDVNEGIGLYHQRFNSGPPSSQYDLAYRTDRTGQGKARFTSIYFQDANGMRISSVPMGEPLRIGLNFECSQPLSRLQIGIAFTTTFGQRLFRLNTSDQAIELPDLCAETSVACDIPSIPLLPGVYSLTIGIDNSHASDLVTSQDHIDAAASLQVLPADVFGTGRIPKGPGDIIFIPSRWTVQTCREQRRYEDG